MAGKFAINVTGKDEDTISGKAGLLQADMRQNVIARLVARGGGRQPVVFRGDADHRLTENPAFRSASSVRPTAKQRSELARREESQGGWGQSEWVEADSPLGFWLGRRPNMHGQAMVVLRRTVEQNLLVVADKAAARAGMISSVVRSLGCLYGPKELVLRVSHAGPNDGCPTVAAAKVDALQRSGFTALMARDPDSTSGLLDEFLAELDQRTSNPQLARTAPAWVWILIEPDRAVPLRRTGDALGRGANPRTERIRKLLESGPASGLHLVVFTNALRLVSTVFDERRDLARFGHRVALQMSDDDSFSLFRSRLASQLQQSRYASESDAIYHNSETGRSVKFRPYLLE
jgi:S-DNA-T family DNA segregation ATPase FtsK/SpoIIIE